MKIAFYTLGCKVNQYETQALEQVLTGRGHTLVPFDGEADAYIINTCTVTAVSDKKSRQMIRRARKAAPRRCHRCVRLLSPDPPGRHGRPGGGSGVRHRGPAGLRRSAGAHLAGAPARHRPGQRLRPPLL